ncbi:hypothetical protein TNCV_311911 [Trichonephila clavipes]|nr:hypothetical protein TNCV_311911 [Trichonephila clavipes]
MMMLGVTGKRNAKRSSIPYLDSVCGLMWVGLPGILNSLNGTVVIGQWHCESRRLSAEPVSILFICATETSRNITARVIERDTSGESYYFLEDFRGFRTRQQGRQRRQNGRQIDR